MLLTLEQDPRRVFEGEALMRKMNMYWWLLDEIHNKLDYVLALTVENFLERRKPSCSKFPREASGYHPAVMLDNYCARLILMQLFDPNWTSGTNIDVEWFAKGVYALCCIRNAARMLLTLEQKDPRRIFEGEALMRKMNMYWLLDEIHNKLDYVLALTVENFLERRKPSCLKFVWPSPSIMLECS
ncbi:Ribosomal protein S4, conserved site-containing protein [Artemisia annua]|uniref:Ribosomal protein S4, conserved site-containing protein n=1 Tax=Artemisia annua TaxID=35608 RepID=A0A2U1PZY2_ARTAN|nr:Ribosomal protein S4, conserved site-containing protein [Artemisia annua]